MNLKALAHEPSTYRGVVWMLTACGLTFNPEQQAAIIALGMALAGVIGAFFPDQRKEPPAPPPNASQVIEKLRQRLNLPPERSSSNGFNDR